MEKLNYWFGTILTIVSLIAIAASYFNVATTEVITIGWCIAFFIGFVAIMQTYHHKSFYSYNPCTFWFWFSLVTAVILFISFTLSAGEFIDQNLGCAIVQGGIISFTPAIGLFLGNCGRILFKKESSAL